MKILFFNSHILWPSHYETELELIKNLSDEGHEIIQVYCNAQLPNCDLNPFMIPEKCDVCLVKHQNGLDLLDQKIRRIPIPELSAEDKKKVSAIPTDFERLEELRSLKIGQFKIGLGIINSIVTINRDPAPSLSDYRPTLQNYIIGSAGIYYAFLKLFETERPDRVYAFSGRFAHTAAVFSACQEKGVDCYLHERGSNLERYSVTPNASITDLDFNKAAILKTWEETDEKTRNEIGANFYNGRRKGIIQNWYSFTKEQVDRLPDNWDPGKRNILIIHSSDDELATAWHDAEAIIYADQISGIRAIAESFSQSDEFHFYLRIHPNFKNVSSPRKKELYALDYPCLTVIPAESTLSTYLLLDSCEKVISFGSTVGIEAAYWGKPSILASHSFYKGLGSTYELETHKELCKLIKDQLMPLPTEGALKYGYYMETFGIPFRHYKSKDITGGYFLGKWIDAQTSLWKKFLNKVITLFPGLSAHVRELRVIKSRARFSN